MTVYHQPEGAASTSLTVAAIDRYEAGEGKDLATRIVNRQGRTARGITVRGTLPSGQPVYFKQTRQISVPIQ
ncbi:hypothetical protein D3C87_2111230 [compost metagenome]